MNSDVLSSLERDFGQISTESYKTPPPTLEADSLGRIYLTWREEQTTKELQAIVERLDRRRDGLHCFVGFRSRATPEDDWQWILARARKNLYSTTAKKELASALKRRASRDLDEHIEQMVIGLDRYLSEGDEAFQLADLPEPAPTPYLIWPFVPEAMHIIVFGPGGTGKSLFCLALALSGMICQPVLPGIRPPEEPINTGFLNWEPDGGNENNINRRRLGELCKGMGLSGSPRRLWYRQPRGSISDNVESIRSLVYRHELRLLIVDSIHKAGEGSVKEDESAKLYNDAISAIQGVPPYPAVISISHVRRSHSRDQEGDNNDPIGAVQYRDDARMTWKLVADNEAGGSMPHLGAFNTKNNVDEYLKNIAWRIEFNRPEGLIRYHSADAQESPVVGQNAPVPDQVEYVLRQGRMKLSDIYAELPYLRKDSISKALRRYDRRFRKFGGDTRDPEYGLADHTSADNSRTVRGQGPDSPAGSNGRGESGEITLPWE